MTQPPQQRDRGAIAQKAERAWLRDKTVTITLSLPKAVFGLLFSLFILIWAFIFGILLGRGHNPEEVFPGLARLMPSPPSFSEAARPGATDETLRPDEPQYHDPLKNKTQPQAIAPSPAAQQSSPATSPAPPVPKPTQTPVPGQTQTAPKQTAATETKPGPAPSRHLYVYQVASSTNAAATEAACKKLQEAGLSAKVEKTVSKGVTWYRIMVSGKGTPDDALALRNALAVNGMPAVILREKKAIP